MKYIALVTEFEQYRNEKPIRSFRRANDAREWIDALHAQLYDNGADDCLESANLYEIKNNGECVLIDEFDGLDRGDGIRAGWRGEFQAYEHRTPMFSRVG